MHHKFQNDNVVASDYNIVIFLKFNVIVSGYDIKLKKITMS